MFDSDSPINGIRQTVWKSKISFGKMDANNWDWNILLCQETEY